MGAHLSWGDPAWEGSWEAFWNPMNVLIFNLSIPFSHTSDKCI